MRSKSPTAVRLVVVATSVAMLVAASPPAAALAGPGELTVSAAASLTEAMPPIAAAFEKANPGVKVRTNLAGSSTLVQQILQGSPADVFASADEPSMQKVVAAGEVAGTPQVFARNRLAIVVQRGNPKQIGVLVDLTQKDLVVALCGPSVPAGRYARELFAKQAVPVPQSSEELDVKAVVSRVALGEADAGIVYTTDARAAGDRADVVAIPEALNVSARYPVAALKSSGDPARAAAFVEFLLGSEAQAILAAHGFLAP